PSTPAGAVAMLPAAAAARTPFWLTQPPQLPQVDPQVQFEVAEIDVVGPGDEVEVIGYGSGPESPPSAPPSAFQAGSTGSEPTRDRYVGSAALESTLDSTIESSLLGVPSGPVTAALLPGASVLELPSQLRGQVITFMADGHEVAAVQLVCDELGCSILEAVQTVRSVS
ncbi:MAG: hypothetical protein WAK18_10480, partial [Nocardioidaceae bacterium]